MSAMFTGAVHGLVALISSGKRKQYISLLRLLILDCKVVLERAIRAGTRNDQARDGGPEGLLDLVRRPHIVDRDESVGHSA